MGVMMIVMMLVFVTYMRMRTLEIVKEKYRTKPEEKYRSCRVDRLCGLGEDMSEGYTRHDSGSDTDEDIESEWTQRLFMQEKSGERAEGGYDEGEKGEKHRGSVGKNGFLSKIVEGGQDRKFCLKL